MKTLALLLVAAFVTVAHAQTPKEADEAFRQGRELLKAGKYAEACEQFNKSQHLDPQLGTLYNIAACSEKLGRIATAVAAYRELVAKDANLQRKASSSERLAALEPKLPKLVVKVDNAPAGLSVTLQGALESRQIAANKSVEVDLGDYTITVRASGYRESVNKVRITEEGKLTTVDAALVAGATNTQAAAIGVTGSSAHQPGSRRRLLAMGAMGTGGAALVTGVVFGVLARAKWSDAKTVCGGTACETPDQLDAATALGDQARTRATISTVLVLTGLALGGAGAYLWVTLPGDAQLAPSAGDGVASVTLRGRF